MPDVALVPVELTETVRSPTKWTSQAPTSVVVAVADIEVRVAAGTDVGYVASLVSELRSRC